MRFTDSQTDSAIRIVSNVIADFGQPLTAPEKVAEYQALAESGDTDAYVRWLSAKLRMLYPVEPDVSKSSPLSLLWASIQDGNLEGILVAEHLNYSLAWEETGGGSHRAAFGSYFDSFCNIAVRNALIRNL